ncbi:MAG: universal stress protein [Pyrinomonadaceae bacterium]
MKVLLAIDGTPQSDSALSMVSSLNVGQISELRVFTVIDMALPMAHDIYTGMIVNTVEIEKAAKEGAKKSLDDAVAKLREAIGDDVAITSDMAVGSPESRIVEEAEEMKADLIVVGSHGYNRWERLLLGSVSDSVIHHAPCSVMVVRDATSE